MNPQRKIIHIDMDAFYASVEQRDRSQYRGKPLVVGGRPEKRGAVAAASYEARQFGIHSAMPSRTALQRCPHLIFAAPRFDVYRGISEQICTVRWLHPLVQNKPHQTESPQPVYLHVGSIALVHAPKAKPRHLQGQSRVKVCQVIDLGFSQADG